MSKIHEKVLVPGTFDPITRGHLDLIRYAAQTYEEVSVGVFINAEKTCMLPLDFRLHLIALATSDLPNVNVVTSDGYTADFATKNGYVRLIRGYRNDDDLAYEKLVADFNKKRGNLPTDLHKTSPDFSSVSSTRVRTALAAGDRAMVTALVPDTCLTPLLAHCKI